MITKTAPAPSIPSGVQSCTPRSILSTGDTSDRCSLIHCVCVECSPFKFWLICSDMESSEVMSHLDSTLQSSFERYVVNFIAILC